MEITAGIRLAGVPRTGVQLVPVGRTLRPQPVPAGKTLPRTVRTVVGNGSGTTIFGGRRCGTIGGPRMRMESGLGGRN